MDYSDFFTSYKTPVKPEWIDYNGHMSEAYYVLVFGFATDTLLDAIGVDETYRGRHQCSVYTLEAHVRYLQEVSEGVAVEVRTVIVASDHKRMHVYHVLQHAETGDVLASTELMLMFVDMRSGRSADFPAAIGADIVRFKARWTGRPEAKELSRTIALPQ